VASYQLCIAIVFSIRTGAGEVNKEKL